MANYIAVQDFGKYRAGDSVELPDDASVPNQFFKPAPVEVAKPDAAEVARLAAVADAEKELAAARAAEIQAHEKDK